MVRPAADNDNKRTVRLNVEIRPTVLLVEDDDSTRTRLSAVIDDHPDLQLIGNAANCADALRILTDTRPTVLLTDLGLPDGNGLDLIRAALENGLATEAMVITVFGDEQHVFNAIEAGATGYLLKDSNAETVATAILQLLAGGSPISPAIARHVLRKLAPIDTHPPPSQSILTERESEVLTLLAKGCAYAEVAAALGMAPGTVTTHVKHLYRKLAVRSRGEAVFEAMQQGLLNITGP